MGRSKPSVRELGHRRSARIEALEICKAAAAEEEAARAAQEAAQNPLQEPQKTSEPARRRGRKKRKCRRTVTDVVVVNSVDQSTGHEQVTGYSDNPNDHHDLHILDLESGQQYYSNPTVPADKQVLKEVLNMLTTQDKRNIFAQPVNPLEVAYYYDTIERPIDLSAMRIKLEQGQYETLEQFEDDVFLMCQNALTFNGSRTIYYREARAMRAVAVKIFRSLRTQLTSVGCKLEDHEVKRVKRSYSKSVSTTDDHVKSRNNGTEGGGGYRSSTSTTVNGEVVLALPACTRSLASTLHGVEEYPLAAAPARGAPESNSRSRRNGGRRPSVVAEERKIKACRLFTSFLSSDEATASTVYNQRTAPLVPAVINGGSYTESLRNFTRDMGPKVREIVEGKMKEIEMKEQQLRAAAEAEMTAIRRMQEQGQLLAAEDRIRRLTRGKGLLQQQPAGRSPSGSTDHHHHHHHHHAAAVNDVLSTSLQFRPGEFMAALMTRNDGPPPAVTGVGDDQGRFAMPGTWASILPGKSSNIINVVEDHHQVLGSSSTRLVSPSLDPGPSFVVPPSRSSTPATAPDIPSLQSWQYVHAAPNLQQVLPMQSGSSLHQLVGPTGLGQLPYHSDGTININNISDLVGNRGTAGQYSSNWQQQLMGTDQQKLQQQQHHPPGFGTSTSTAGATQFQERRRPQYDPYPLLLPGLPTTHLQYSGTTSSNSNDIPRRPLELSNIYQFQQQPGHVQGSSSSANPQQQQQQQQQVLAPSNMVVGTTPTRPSSTQQQGLMQFNRYDHMNINNVHPINMRHRHVFPGSIDHMGPISTTAPAPGVAWMMKAFGTTAGGGDADRPPFIPGGHQPSPPSSNTDHHHQGVALPSHNIVPGSSSGGGDARLRYQLINNQQMGPNNWVNQQMGSSPTGPMGLLLTDHGPPSQDYNNLGRNIDTTAGPVSDPLAQQSTAGIFDLSLVRSCLRTAADRNASDATSSEQPGLLRSSFSTAGVVSTSQQLQPTEGEFLEILENAQPADLAHQL